MITEIGRLAQGLKYGIKVTNYIRFIQKKDIPLGRKSNVWIICCGHQTTQVIVGKNSNNSAW
jgi:hypothetical protein